MQRAALNTLRPSARRHLTRPALRALATAPPPQSPTPESAPTPGPAEPYRHEKAPPPPQSWLTRQLKQSPAAMRVFLKVFGALGYGSSRQVSARRALALYENLCAGRADEDRAFWQDECRLPPTFQSWFTITNLHVWLLTTRLRALPAPHGEQHVQGLIDHFFLDVEERIRIVLQPQAAPDALPSTAEQVRQQATAYYTAVAAPRSKGRGRAPESTVSRQMKIFREQWAGLGMAFDLGLIHGDAELAGAVWRNLLGARAAHGIAYEAAGKEGAGGFRRTINPSGEIEKYGKIDEEALRREEARDDGSGVHDFAPDEIDLYVGYPETMATLVAYVRREIVRLAEVPDEAIIGGKERSVVGKEAVGLDKLKFGRIADARKVAEGIIEEVQL